MKIFLLKNVEKVGMAGEIIKAKDGYAINYLIPNKLGVAVTDANEKNFAHRAVVIDQRKEVIASKTSMLAEKIKSMTVTLKRKTHDKDKLFGSINAAEIAQALSEQGVAVTKSQVEIAKSIKAVGTHTVTIKLSSSLKPELTVKIVAE
jgi:large subunit ribosomal protein L9